MGFNKAMFNNCLTVVAGPKPKSQVINNGFRGVKAMCFKDSRSIIECKSKAPHASASGQLKEMGKAVGFKESGPIVGPKLLASQAGKGQLIGLDLNNCFSDPGSFSGFAKPMSSICSIELLPVPGKMMSV